MLGAENKKNMTKDVLDALERTIQLKELATQQDFESALNLDKVVIYLLVDWSRPERASRYVV